MQNRILSLVITAAWAASLLHGGETWPQWRGPTRDGQFSGPSWPDSLEEARLVQRWRFPQGPGYSGPIVTADTVFTTETVGKKSERVTALDRSTGKPRWTREWEGSLSVPFFAKSNGDWIRCTPAWDGTNLFVGGMRDVLVALDGATGNERWRLDFVKDSGSDLPTFGFVSSPLVDAGSLYVQAGGGVAKVEAASGKILWHTCKDGGGMMGSAFGSPVILTLAGRRQLVVQSRTRLIGVGLEDGAELWSLPVESFRGMNILTPVQAGPDRLFTSTYGGKTLGIDLRKDGDAFRAAVAWEFKAQGYMTSPVVVGEHAYLQLRSQRALCIDLRDGKEAWTTRESFGKYWSLVANRDRILALDERGELILFRADPAKFEVLSRRKISESDTWAHLAAAGNNLYVRALDGITAWDWVPAPTR
jgi:outer membrane protein assembly factor BamB